MGNCCSSKSGNETNGRRILLIDPFEERAKLAADFLSRAGFKVTVCPSPSAASHLLLREWWSLRSTLHAGVKNGYNDSKTVERSRDPDGPEMEYQSPIGAYGYDEGASSQGSKESALIPFSAEMVKIWFSTRRTQDFYDHVIWNCYQMQPSLLALYAVLMHSSPMLLQEGQKDRVPCTCALDAEEKFTTMAENESADDLTETREELRFCWRTVRAHFLRKTNPSIPSVDAFQDLLLQPLLWGANIVVMIPSLTASLGGDSLLDGKVHWEELHNQKERAVDTQTVSSTQSRKHSVCPDGPPRDIDYTSEVAKMLHPQHLPQPRLAAPPALKSPLDGLRRAMGEIAACALELSPELRKFCWRVQRTGESPGQRKISQSMEVQGLGRMDLAKLKDDLYARLGKRPGILQALQPLVDQAVSRSSVGLAMKSQSRLMAQRIQRFEQVALIMDELSAVKQRLASAESNVNQTVLRQEFMQGFEQKQIMRERLLPSVNVRGQLVSSVLPKLGDSQAQTQTGDKFTFTVESVCYLPTTVTSVPVYMIEQASSLRRSIQKTAYWGKSVCRTVKVRTTPSLAISEKDEVVDKQPHVDFYEEKKTPFDEATLVVELATKQRAVDEEEPDDPYATRGFDEVEDDMKWLSDRAPVEDESVVKQMQKPGAGWNEEQPRVAREPSSKVEQTPTMEQTPSIITPETLATHTSTPHVKDADFINVPGVINKNPKVTAPAAHGDVALSAVEIDQLESEERFAHGFSAAQPDFMTTHAQESNDNVEELSVDDTIGASLGTRRMVSAPHRVTATSGSFFLGIPLASDTTAAADGGIRIPHSSGTDQSAPPRMQGTTNLGNMTVDMESKLSSQPIVEVERVDEPTEVRKYAAINQAAGSVVENAISNIDPVAMMTPRIAWASDSTEPSKDIPPTEAATDEAPALPASPEPKISWFSWMFGCTGRSQAPVRQEIPPLPPQSRSADYDRALKAKRAEWLRRARARNPKLAAAAAPVVRSNPYTNAPPKPVSAQPQSSGWYPPPEEPKEIPNSSESASAVAVTKRQTPLVIQTASVTPIPARADPVPREEPVNRVEDKTSEAAERSPYHNSNAPFVERGGGGFVLNISAQNDSVPEQGSAPVNIPFTPIVSDEDEAEDGSDFIELEVEGAGSANQDAIPTANAGIVDALASSQSAWPSADIPNPPSPGSVTAKQGLLKSLSTPTTPTKSTEDDYTRRLMLKKADPSPELIAVGDPVSLSSSEHTRVGNMWDYVDKHQRRNKVVRKRPSEVDVASIVSLRASSRDSVDSDLSVRPKTAEINRNMVPVSEDYFASSRDPEPDSEAIPFAGFIAIDDLPGRTAGVDHFAGSATRSARAATGAQPAHSRSGVEREHREILLHPRTGQPLEVDVDDKVQARAMGARSAGTALHDPSAQLWDSVPPSASVGTDSAMRFPSAFESSTREVSRVSRLASGSTEPHVTGGSDGNKVNLSANYDLYGVDRSSSSRRSPGRKPVQLTRSDSVASPKDKGLSRASSNSGLLRLAKALQGYQKEEGNQRSSNPSNSQKHSAQHLSNVSRDINELSSSANPSPRRVSPGSSSRNPYRRSDANQHPASLRSTTRTRRSVSEASIRVPKTARASTRSVHKMPLPRNWVIARSLGSSRVGRAMVGAVDVPVSKP